MKQDSINMDKVLNLQKTLLGHLEDVKLNPIEQAIALEGAAALIRNRQVSLCVLQQQMNFLNPRKL